MATVYLAWDLRHDRPVAIKVLHADLSHAVGAERFEREIKVAARLSHPHVLTLHDSGNANGLLYYIMPYVEGESLRDRIEREKILPIDEAVQIAREVADALAYAHRLGIIHRDIKPENILLSDGHALVADFGIARAVSSAGSDKLTQTGTSLGTPLYMSPENAHGDAVGPSSDLYSLGCVLYEMLSGAPPFTGPNNQAILARHALDPVPRLRTVRGTVPESLEDVVLAALNKLPADRPQSAARFREMLSEASDVATGRSSGSRSLGARPVVRSPVSLASSPLWRRRWRWAALVILLPLAAVAVWQLASSESQSAGVLPGPDRTHLAVLYFDDLSPTRELRFVADGLTEGLIEALASVNGLTVVSRGGVAGYRGGSVTRDSMARAFHVGTLVIGAVEREADSIRVTVRLLDDGGIELDRASFKKAASDLVGLADSLPSETARLIRLRLGRTVSLSRTRAGTRNTEAWASYQRALGARAIGDSLFRAHDQARYDREYTVADSLATLAARLDAKWVHPVILRGLLQYWRSRRARTAVGERVAHVDSGLKHANRALELDPKNPDALELRGNLRYWRWLSRTDTVPTIRSALLTAAQQDLETAATATPPKAGAWASLSHLYYQVAAKTSVDILFAATKALELDAYLDNADVVYNRLILGSYDAEKLEEASRWCKQARTRFPADRHFVTCSLWLALAGFTPPNPLAAWALLDTAIALTSDGERNAVRLEGRLIVAGVLGRANLVDSARNVLRRTPMDTVVDPLRETMPVRAYAWLLLGDRDQALATLRAFFDVPEARRGVTGPSWWFRELSDDPRYRAMAVSGRG
jgi:eukaryotic-like serine/threonine-protein kinase